MSHVSFQYDKSGNQRVVDAPMPSDLLSGLMLGSESDITFTKLQCTSHSVKCVLLSKSSPLQVAKHDNAVPLCDVRLSLRRSKGQLLILK